MNKFELARQIEEDDLSPEALAEIATVLEKHRTKTHDAALETASENLTGSQLVEIWKACFQGAKKTSGLTAAEFEQKIKELGFLKLFSRIKADKNVIFLTDKSGITWVLPLDPSTPAYLPGRMFDTDAINNRFDSMKELVAPCHGKFEDGNFQVEVRGKVI